MHRLFRLAAGVAVACAVSNTYASGPDGPTRQSPPASIVQRFLAKAEEPPVEYRALRRLEASNAKFHQSAWMVAWTEFDRVKGLTYQIVDEGGSGYIRSKVLRAA